MGQIFEDDANGCGGSEGNKAVNNILVFNTLAPFEYLLSSGGGKHFDDNQPTTFSLIPTAPFHIPVTSIPKDTDAFENYVGICACPWPSAFSVIGNLMLSFTSRK
jgi:hypothetical protein